MLNTKLNWYLLVAQFALSQFAQCEGTSFVYSLIFTGAVIKMNVSFRMK